MTALKNLPPQHVTREVKDRERESEVNDISYMLYKTKDAVKRQEI